MLSNAVSSPVMLEQQYLQRFGAHCWTQSVESWYHFFMCTATDTQGHGATTRPVVGCQNHQMLVGEP
jgi:hypothetical protein